MDAAEILKVRGYASAVNRAVDAVEALELPDDLAGPDVALALASLRQVKVRVSAEKGFVEHGIPKPEPAPEPEVDAESSYTLEEMAETAPEVFETEPLEEPRTAPEFVGEVDAEPEPPVEESGEAHPDLEPPREPEPDPEVELEDEVEEPEEDDEVEYITVTVDDLKAMTRGDLVAIAEAQGIDIKSRDRRDDVFRKVKKALGL